MQGNSNSILSNKIIPITSEEFQKISKLVYTHFGINLTDKKLSLVTGRLQKVLKQMNFSSFSEYIHYVENSTGTKALSELVNRISTNHTFFYREYDHFEFMMQVALPEIEAYHRNHNNNNIKLWCAASSSGEEPYTIIIHLLQYFGTNYSNWNAGLLATDISEEALGKAVKGIYPDGALTNVPDSIKKKYFQKHDTNYAISETIKKEVLYKKFNLMTPTFPFKGGFDIIFCRNVMIYFDRITKERLVNKLYQQLRPGGYLFIGHAETLNGLNTPFKYVKSAVFQR